MTINEIRESGLLELYVLGTLEGEELRQMEQAISQFPELKQDLNNIEHTLQQYATANAVIPSEGLKKRVLNEVNKTAKPQEEAKELKNKTNNKSSGFWFLPIIILGLLCAALAYLWNNSNQRSNQLQQELDELIESCDSIRQESDKHYANYQSLINPNNDIVAVAVQPKYPDTELYFYHNPIDKKNFLQLQSIPAIDNNTQSYQLWSLKPNAQPIPLTVFQSQDSTILEMQYEEGTTTYAITIEPKGGQETPTLANLIGTFSI